MPILRAVNGGGDILEESRWALVGRRRYDGLKGRALIFDGSRRLLAGIGRYVGLRGEHAYSFGNNMRSVGYSGWWG